MEFPQSNMQFGKIESQAYDNFIIHPKLVAAWSITTV